MKSPVEDRYVIAMLDGFAVFVSPVVAEQLGIEDGDPINRATFLAIPELELEALREARGANRGANLRPHSQLSPEFSPSHGDPSKI